MRLREKARGSYNHPNRETHERALNLELALRLSGDTPVLDSTKKSTISLADSPAFRDVHPVIIGYLEEFGPLSGIVTPARVEGEQQEQAEDNTCAGEPWQTYLGP